MKKIHVIVLLLLACYNLHAENNSSVIEQSKYCFAICQHFDGQGVCSPSFGNSEIYYNEINNENLLRNVTYSEKIIFIDTIYYDTGSGCFKIGKNGIVTKIIVKSHIKGMENDKTQIFEYEINKLKIGENKKTARASDPCYNRWNDFHGGHRNSYTLTTNLIYDVPIDIENTSKETLIIENNETIIIKISNFYNNKDAKLELQYKKNGNDDTQWCTVTNVVPTANANLSLRFEDLVGNEGCKGYKECAGKFISIRAVKTLINGKKTFGQTIEKVRFYHRGPDFEIKEIRRPACEDLHIYVKVNKDEFSKYDINSNYNYKWVLSLSEEEIDDEKNNARCFYVEATDYDNEFIKLTGSDIEDENTTLNTYIKEHIDQNPNIEYHGKLQLQYKKEEKEEGESDGDGEGMDFVEKDFIIPPKLPAINIDTIQNDASSFADANNPYVYLKIIDDDTTRIRKRLSYDVECWNGANFDWLYPINSPIDTLLSEEEAKKSFNSDKQYHQGYSFAKYDSGDPVKDKEDFVRDTFYKWYDDLYKLYPKLHVEIKSTVKLGKNGSVPTKSDWDIEHYKKNNGYDVILRTTHDEKNGNGEYETYTYLCKFRIEDKNNFDRIPSSASYIKFKGDDVATHITGQVSINSLSYTLYYKDQSVDGGLKISYLKTVTENGNSSLKPFDLPVDINAAGNLVQYIGKGNGYYLVKMLEGGTGQCMLIDMSTFHEAIGFQGINASCFEDYDTTYVVNDNLLACKDDNDDVYVWHDNEFYNMYYKSSKPVFYSVEDKDGTGFTYWVNGEKYFRRYNSFSKNELYAYFKTNQVINCPSNKYDNAWNEFKYLRNKYWQKYLKDKNSYKITNIPQKDYLNKTGTEQLAFSGKLRIKDSDGCYSDTVDYVYKYYDLLYKETVKKLPSSPVAEDGEVELSFTKGALAPYKCLKNGTKISDNFNSNNTITVSNIGYQGASLQFVDSKNDTITRKIEIEMPFDCSATPQTCQQKGGSITITKKPNVSISNPDSIIILNKNDSVICFILTKQKSFPIIESKIPIGDYIVKASYIINNTYYRIALKEDIKISDSSFFVSATGIPATEIGGTGSIIVSTKNVQGNITWENAPSNYNLTENKFMNVPAKVYDNISVIHTYNETCPTALGTIEVQSPKINFTRAQISYNADTDTATFDIISSGNNLIDNYTLYLTKKVCQNINDVTMYKVAEGINKTGKVSFTYENTLYYLYVVYANNSKIKLLTGNGIETPILGNKCNAVADANNSTRCYGADGIITLNGTGCEYSINQSSFTSYNDGFTIYRDSGSYSIDIKKSSQAELDFCNDGVNAISQTVTKHIDITIPKALPLEYSIIAPNITCYGANDGSISIKATANAHGDVVFAIRNDDGTISDFSDSITNLNPNIYNIVIQDGYCKDYPYYVDSIEISQPDEPLEFKSIATTDPTCWNDDGKIEVVVKGGWNEFEKCYNISLHEQKNFDTTTVNRYNPESIVSFEKLEHKDYTIYATDYGNCTISKDTNLVKYQNPYVTSAVFDSVTCYGWNDGVIDTIKFETDCKVDGEPLELFYTKETGAPSNTANWIEYSPSIKNLTAGGYNIWLKDTNQCVSDEPFHIKVEQPDSLILSITAENTIIREYGKPGGSVNVNVSGGNKGTFNIFLDTKKDTLAQVIWGDHVFNDIFRPGTHKLYVTDHKECIDSATTEQMRQPDSPLSIEATPHDALCNGSFGSITVRGSGGWNGYQYSCSSKSNLYGANQNEYTFYDIKGGYYEVSVTDAEGVTATQKVYVNTPPKLMAVPLLRASSCKNDGLISANITGGTMPYLVKPDSNSVTPFYFEPYTTNSGLTTIPNNVAAGDYSIIIVDSNKCEILMSAVIADSSVKASVKTGYPTAHEFANGRLEAVVQQGPAPYTYLWKNHNTGETSTSAVWDKVGAGVYSLEVTDANNCSVSVPITYLATNGDLPLIIDTIIDETAVGACNGMANFTSDTTGFKSITLYGNSGVEKDVTSLVNNKLQFDLTGLAPDSYLLECVLADTTVRYAKFTIARYEPMHLLVSNIVDVSKQDDANGSAALRIDGGRAPFNIQILCGDDFLADTILNGRNLPMAGLTAENYTVSVVDESANRVNAQFVIRKPEKPLQLLAQSVENPSCYGYTNGRIILKATGGWGDYEYAAVDGEFGRAIAYDGRGAAVHTFVTIDSKGITDTLSVELVEPQPLTASVVQVDSVSCFGRTDGSVTFDIAGGTAPYTVHYDDFFDKKSNFVGSLNAGTHTFNITDSNFCRAVEGSLAVDIPQPDVLQVAHDSVIHTTCNTDNGRIFITIAGGTAPYANSWREDGLIKERFANLTAIDSLQGYSLYEVEVADAKGCKTGKSYRINPSSGPKIERVRTLPVLCHGDSTGTAIIDSADIVPATPYSPFRIEWPHGENAMSVGNLPAGWNVVFIIDSNNCKNSTSFNIDAPSPIGIRKVGSRDASCYGYADGRISTLALGGVGGYRYLWSNGDTLPDIDSIAKGAYTIVVADRNNCRDSAVFAIGQPDSLHVEIGEENVLMCPDNTYEFIPTDGFKTYRWILNDSTLSDKRNLIASEQGEYHLVATYGANCISRDTVTITIGDDLLEADFYMASDASKDNTIALVELSNMKTDSIRWDFSATDFEVMDSSLYELQLKPNTIGRHNITLWAYSSGCVSYITKQVEISELPDTTDNIKLGYDPLIKSVTVKPNPTNGQFGVDVQLRESHEAEMTISSVSHGTQIEQRKLAGDAEYSESFDLSNASDGVYILRISASDEHRVMKVLIAK